MIHEHHDYEDLDPRDLRIDYDPHLAIHNALGDLRYAFEHRHALSATELMLVAAAIPLLEGIENAR